FNQGDRPLPGYTIQRGVGRGGFGEVYYATSDGGKEVALKYLRENPQVELRGVTHCLNLKSPYLVSIHDIRQNAEGDSFVIMEYVSGPSLRDLLNAAPGEPGGAPSGLGPQKAAYFLREIGKGLSYLHDRGIVHRDMKPGNIFYEDGYVKIGDYGLAKIMAASQHSGQTVSVGTVHYMAPEVGSGNYDRTIDIYALGVILYEMLLGRVPYSGATMGEVLMKHLTAQPEVDELPEPFPRVIRKALAKDPKDRYQSVNELVSEVFDVADINRSVASFDTLNLTRMAATVGRRVGAAVAAGVGGRRGSSHVPPLGETPPVVVQPGGSRPARLDPGHGRPGVQTAFDRDRPFWNDFKRRPFGLRDAATFPQRYRLTTGLLGVFLGHLGIHRFYTGHNRLGLAQILVTCFTGIGALWGIIEGLQILLNGDFRDALGRPLLERSQRPRRAGRSTLARGLWGGLGGALLLVGTGLVLGGTFAAPDWERIDLDPSAVYAANTYHLMYAFAGAALALSAMCVWKASHRAGLPAWRRNVRPALMCGLLAVMAVAWTVESYFLPGNYQSAGLIVLGVAAVGFVALWFLRGPDVPPRRDDAYWNRAWARMFLLAACLAVFAGLRTYHTWKASGGVFENPARANATAEIASFAGYNYLSRRSERTTQEYPIIERRYNHLPIAAGLLLLLTAGCCGEARYRRRHARRAERVVAETE
ncbi:MAG: protein kinase, partial [Candidatus Krumholzibacteriia bacterium]